MSGITLKVHPLSGEIGSYETVFFDIIASSNTWGIYTDEITVNIDLMPPYTFWVRIINSNSPISYPICRNSSIKTPKIRFAIRSFWPRNNSDHIIAKATLFLDSRFSNLAVLSEEESFWLRTQVRFRCTSIGIAF